MVEEVPSITPEPNPEIIARLEEFLEMAKSGELKAIAIAGMGADNSSMNCFIAEEWPMALLGVMEIIRRDIIDMHISTRCHKAGSIY